MKVMTRPNSKNMDVIYVATDNFAIYAGVSIQSLLEHSTWADQVNVNLVNMDISTDNLQKIKSIIKKFPNTRLKLRSSHKWVKTLSQTNIQTYKGNFAAYLRLFAIAEIPSESGLILYLDADTLVLDSLEDLFSRTPSQALSVVETDYPKRNYFTKFPTLKFTSFSDGTVLADQSQLSAINYSQRLQEAFQLSWKNDEELIRYVYKNDIARLHYSYNVMPNIFFVNPKLYQRLSGYNNDPVGEQVFQVASGQTPIRIAALISLGGQLPWENLEGNYNPFAKAWHDTLAKTDFINDYVPPPVPHSVEATLKHYLPKTLVTLIIPFFWGRSHRYLLDNSKHPDPNEVARVKLIRERYGLPIPDHYPNI
jgi:lipopolysaccharide biosynthesis glycosyltransferase